MGIKFRCPNGHKLNVKSFLAGKRGVCPKCGTSVRIPQPSPEEAREAADDGDDLLDEARFPAPGRAAAARHADTAMAAAALPVAMPTAQVAPAASPFPAGATIDPIAESPSAVWYVRPPGGGQYGPARGDVMRRWLTEGRVSHDSLVWREDWSDWREASAVFGALESEAPQPPSMPAAAPLPAKEEPVATGPRTSRLINRYEARKKQGSGLGIAAIVVLGLLCVVLGILLVYFIGGFHNGGEKAPSPRASTSGAGD